MEERNTGSGKWKVYLAVLALIILVLLFWLFIQRSQLMKLVREKEVEKMELQQELDSLMTEHNTVKTAYGSLSDSLASKDSIIQANAIEIRKLLDTQWEYNKVRKRIGLLQKIAQGYVNQIDSLYNVNRELKAENERIMQDVRTEQSKNQTLVKDKEELTQKMSEAAFLKAYNVNVTAYRVAGTKETATDKASRTDRLRICFTIGENPLVQPGNRSVYIRIMRPDNVVVTKSKYDTFVFNGQTIPFSIREDINYQGKAMNLCVDWTKKDTDKPAMKGRYTVTVFTEDKEIGSSTFELK
jgi:predicted Holliday junction resolvase-like endonuclease